MEMSFVDETDVHTICEGMIKDIFSKVARCGPVTTPFARMEYAEAIRRYGVDKPDTTVRNGAFRCYRTGQRFRI